MEAPIDVALCFDGHFALPGALTLLSLLRSNPHVRAHVVTEARGEAVRLIRAIADAQGGEVHVLDRSPEAGHAVNADSDYGTRSTATYRRLFLAGLLPGLDRLLYLDADVLVRGPLDALWETDLEDRLLAAVPDPWASTLPEMRARFPGGYFNAGVLLIDLARWRAERITERTLDFIASPEGAVAAFHDQTPLNEMARGRWRRVSHRWNYTTLHSARLAGELGLDATEHEVAVADPTVVHFLAAYKPWVAGFERLTRWHGEYAALRRELETDFDLGGLVWPGAFINSQGIATRRRMMALRLVAAAQAEGLQRPTIMLTGLLGHEIGIVAREQGYALDGFASEYSAMSGGELLGLPIRSIEEALDRGCRDFVLGDYRRLARTRAALAEAATARGLPIRMLDLDTLRRAA